VPYYRQNIATLTSVDGVTRFEGKYEDDREAVADMATSSSGLYMLVPSVADAVPTSDEAGVAVRSSLAGMTLDDALAYYRELTGGEDPLDPVDPEDPVDPVDPEDPVDPVDPVDPEDPEDPEDPVDPVDGGDDPVDTPDTDEPVGTDPTPDTPDAPAEDGGLDPKVLLAGAGVAGVVVLFAVALAGLGKRKRRNEDDE
jgi:hypothetical protein